MQWLSKVVYGMVLLFLLVTLVSVGLKTLYPIGVFILALLASALRARRQHSRVREER